MIENVLKVDIFDLRTHKVVPNSDPSVIVMDIYRAGVYWDTISLDPLEALQLSKNLIEHVLEPEE